MNERKGKIVCGQSLCHAVFVLIFLLPVFAFIWQGLWENGRFTVSYWKEVFLSDQRYLLKFWKSVGLTLTQTLGQIAVAAMAAYGLEIYRVPGRKVIFAFLLVMILLPIQVMLVPQYIVLDRVGLLNTVWAMMVPYFFMPFSTFFLMIFFRKMDQSVLEAARIDGAGSIRILLRIVIPMEKEAFGALGLLLFLNTWCSVEQPMAFLKDMHQYPFAVYLMTAPSGQRGRLSVCSFLSMILVCVFAMIFGRKLYEKV